MLIGCSIVYHPCLCFLRLSVSNEIKVCNLLTLSTHSKMNVRSTLKIKQEWTFFKLVLCKFALFLSYIKFAISYRNEFLNLFRHIFLLDSWGRNYSMSSLDPVPMPFCWMTMHSKRAAPLFLQTDHPPFVSCSGRNRSRPSEGYSIGSLGMPVPFEYFRVGPISTAHTIVLKLEQH